MELKGGGVNYGWDYQGLYDNMHFSSIVHYMALALDFGISGLFVLDLV